MIVIEARNVNDALTTFCDVLAANGVRRGSRYGEVTYIPVPVTTHYMKPTERVLFSRERDANPFFHFFESLWMLAGRNDVAFPARFAANIASFSDDGKTFNGAYGHRWRGHFGHDQLKKIIETLRANPDDRRCVLQMWDGRHDLGLASKDVPCNTAAYLSVNAVGEVDMTVTNRSNDAVWGCYGANAVHFSMLQEYVAGHLGRSVGSYWQMSNNLHVYEATRHLLPSTILIDNYFTGAASPMPMFSPLEKPGAWDEDLEMFLDNPANFGLRHSFFRRVATPMWMTFSAYANRGDADRFSVAREILSQCRAEDWRQACLEWLGRREVAAQAAAQRRAAREEKEEAA